MHSKQKHFSHASVQELQSILFNKRRTKKKNNNKWPNHWTVNMVSVAFAGPFITLGTVILGTLKRTGYISSTHTAPPLPASNPEQKLDSPTCNVSICSLCAAQQQENLQNPTQRQANLDCNTMWQEFLLDASPIAKKNVSWMYLLCYMWCIFFIFYFSKSQPDPCSVL